MSKNIDTQSQFKLSWTPLVDGATFFASSAALTEAATKVTWLQNPLTLQGWALSSAVNTLSLSAARSLGHINDESSLYKKVAFQTAGFFVGAALLAMASKPLSLYAAIQLTPYTIAQSTAFHAAVKTVLYASINLIQYFKHSKTQKLDNDSLTNLDFTQVSDAQLRGYHKQFCTTDFKLSIKQYEDASKGFYRLNLAPPSGLFILPEELRKPEKPKDVKENQALWLKNFYFTNQPAFHALEYNTQIIIRDILKKFEKTKEFVLALKEPQKNEMATLSKETLKLLRAQFEGTDTWAARSASYQRALNQALENADLDPIEETDHSLSTWQKVGVGIIAALSLSGAAYSVKSSLEAKPPIQDKTSSAVCSPLSLVDLATPAITPKPTFISEILTPQQKAFNPNILYRCLQRPSGSYGAHLAMSPQKVMEMGVTGTEHDSILQTETLPTASANNKPISDFGREIVNSIQTCANTVLSKCAWTPKCPKKAEIFSPKTPAQNATLTPCKEGFTGIDCDSILQTETLPTASANNKPISDFGREIVNSIQTCANTVLSKCAWTPKCPKKAEIFSPKTPAQNATLTPCKEGFTGIDCDSKSLAHHATPQKYTTNLISPDEFEKMASKAEKKK